MKTKHYLFLVASVITGIILGVVFSTGIMHKRQMRFVQEKMEYGSLNSPNFEKGQQVSFGNSNKREKRKSNKQRVGNGSMKSKRSQMKGNNSRMTRMLSILDLSEAQQLQVDAIFEKNQEKFEKMQELRESRWEATTEEVKDILTDEQRKNYDELMDKPGKKNHAPGLYMALRRYDLTAEQKEKIEALQKRNKDMRDAMMNGINQEREETMEQIKSILTKEQINKFDDLPAYNRGKGRKRT